MAISKFGLTIRQDPDGSIPYVICEGAGNRCIVKTKTTLPAFERDVSNVDYFVAPGGALQDGALDDLAKKINQMLSTANDARKDKNAKLGFLLTPRGYMVVWKYEEASLAPSPKPGSKSTSLDDITDEEAEKLFWPGS